MQIGCSVLNDSDAYGVGSSKQHCLDAAHLMPLWQVVRRDVDLATLFYSSDVMADIKDTTNKHI